MDEAERLMNGQLQAMKSLAAMGHPKAEAMLEDRDRALADNASVSDQIRALDRRGYSRADIARLLGKRYQHVRNVLEEDKLRTSKPTAASPEPPPAALAEVVSSRASAAAWVSTNSSPIQGVEPDASVHGDIVRLRVRPDGSVLLPPEVLERLQARVGGMIIGDLLEEGEMILRGPHATLRKIQELIPPWKPGEPLWSEELIADRREENRRESEGG